MPSREEIEARLNKYKPFLAERFKVKKIGLFGSCIRGELTEGSDVDILVEFSVPIGWEFIDLKDFLESLLGLKVDLVTEGALKPQMKDRILQEVVYQ